MYPMKAFGADPTKLHANTQRQVRDVQPKPDPKRQYLEFHSFTITARVSTARVYARDSGLEIEAIPMVLHFRWQIVKRTLQYQLLGLVTQKSRLLWWLGIILTTGFLGSSLLSYVAARNTVRDNIVNQGLPLTSDTVYSEVQRELLRPISISAQMAENTFLREWVQAGETDIGPVVRYLRNIKDHFTADSSFFISERTRRCYHPLGIQQVVSESDPKDTWYF